MGDKKFKLKVDKAKCLGCATCTSIYPMHFTMGSDGKSQPTGNTLVSQEEADEIVKVCPVAAISYEEHKQG